MHLSTSILFQRGGGADGESLPEPEFLVMSWLGVKSEVTSGQYRIFPVLQLLLNITNQNKPDQCSCPGFVQGQVGWGGKVAKYYSYQDRHAMWGWGGS
jgi:hypothetical protein